MPELLAERLDALTGLDFDPDEEHKDSEACEAYGNCDRTPAWRFTPTLSCPHDGRTLLSCDFHQKLADNYFYVQTLLGATIFCTDCGTGAQMINWKWERL